MFEAVLFDNDGVLVDSETIHVQVELDLLAQLGLHYDYSAYTHRFVGLGQPEFLTALAADYAAEGRGEFPPGFAQELEAQAWPAIEQRLQPLPNLDPLLAATAHLPRAVASSALSSKLAAKLKLVGLYDTFSPHIYSAEAVAHSKPAPDLYRFAADQLRVNRHRCLVIEDSVNGVRAAVAAGMSVVGYVGGGHADAGLGARLSAAGARAIFADHAQIADALRDRAL